MGRQRPIILIKTMATKEQQKEWRDRHKAGIATRYCACGTKILKSKLHDGICKKCWRKTPEGKKYAKEKMQESKAQFDWSKTPEGKEYYNNKSKEYRKTPEGREYNARKVREYYQRNKEKKNEI